ncbi:hypothetical protein LJR219_000574 [Phenylobacterium sp. LjRoot219]|uniref:hypothetical protein n=1 Tax=Phenylobacterium sp. LjRoot219 TaxID=3342283 RepID=UPI003ECE4461
MAARAEVEEAYEIVSVAVDQAFYRTANPELDDPGLDPIRHYLERGWREGRDPAPWFSVRRYLELHRDVAAGGQEPLQHYLRYGGREGRAIFPSSKAEAFRRAGGDGLWDYPPKALAPAAQQVLPPSAEELKPAPLVDPATRVVVAAEFDSRFYLETNPDIADAGVDPIEHFLLHGWEEGRDPCPQFSVREYLTDNPDVADAGINPFVHYLQAGRAEGRCPRNALGFRYKIIAGLSSLEARVAEAANRAAAVAPTAEAFAAAAAAAGSRSALMNLHVTFSHDDFSAHVGGVQLCLQHEAAEFAKLGRDHLHLCPATPWPVLRRGQPAALSAILNGRLLGSFSAEAVADGLAALRGPGARGSFAIHNLLGHDVDEVLAILDAAGLNAGVFWLHDFTSLCAGYQLLRNDVQDCGAPPADSAACNVCLYGPGRAPQSAEHERLFGKLELTVVSPAQVTLDFWRARASYPTAGEVVHPHLQLIPRAAQPAPVAASGPLRLAFLGMPAAHKGWPIFAELATEFAADPRYRFLHLGSRRDPRAPVEFHPVSVSLEDPAAMRRTLEELEVDVAVIWSIFRETFCLAAYEAIAAGAAIVTSPDSANVAALVAAGGAGRVLADEAALTQALRSGDLLDLARSVRRPALYDLAFSGMSADLAATGAAA